MPENESTTTEPVAEVTPANTEPTRLPGDHPLVTTLASQKQQIAELKKQVAAASDGSKTAEERIVALEKRAATAERAAQVKAIQVEHGISDADAELFLTAPDEKTLKAQAVRLAGQRAEREQHGNFVPREIPQSTTSVAEQFAAALEGRL